jgi:hypothetical protein
VCKGLKKATAPLFASLDREEHPERSTTAVTDAEGGKTLLALQAQPGRLRTLLNELEILELDGCTVVATTIFHFVPLTDSEADPVNVSESNARSFARALPNRDMTVPTGQSKTPAIS